MKIEGVVISCYPLDLQLTRICVASVRFWYPYIPIWLLKDRHYGDFDTREIEKYWNVQVYPTRQNTLGWGFGKLEVLTELPKRRLLVLDSDIVFAGRVIERLEMFDEDFVVAKEDSHDAAGIERHFFSLTKILHLDPEFKFPGYGFNTGQIAATTGVITRKELDGLVDWQTRTVTHPDIFKMGEQGLCNYVVFRQAQQGKLTIRREPFMVWPGEAALTRHIQLSDFTAGGPHQQVIHWAGFGWGKSPENMPRSEILLFFEDIYYRGIPFGASIRQLRRMRVLMRRALLIPLKAAVRRVLNTTIKRGLNAAR
jgi:hypothetical protein